MTSEKFKEEFQRGDACFFISPNIVNHREQYILCIAISGETEFYETEENLGDCFETAAKAVRKRNYGAGISPEQVQRIICSTFALRNEISQMIKEVERGL